jgi:hypothetical protein
MDVTTIKAGIKFSKDTGQGWKTVELGAEGAVGLEEDWCLAQQGLYAMLTVQLRTLWNQNMPSPERARNGAERPIEDTWEEMERPPQPG